jgi:hypothetical protein
VPSGKKRTGEHPRASEAVIDSSSEKKITGKVPVVSFRNNQHSTPQQVKPPQKISFKAEMSPEEKKRVVSTDQQQLKARSAKVLPKASPTLRKMTKEEYIAYLRSKKGNS